MRHARRERYAKPSRGAIPNRLTDCWCEVPSQGRAIFVIRRLSGHKWQIPAVSRNWHGPCKYPGIGHYRPTQFDQGNETMNSFSNFARNAMAAFAAVALSAGLMLGSFSADPQVQ